jgi:hypothetical protein
MTKRGGLEEAISSAAVNAWLARVIIAALFSTVSFDPGTKENRYGSSFKGAAV